MKADNIELEELKRRVAVLTPASSPRSEARRITVTPTENKIMIDAAESENRIVNEYTCCCFPRPTDRRLLSFLAQLGLSTLVMCFCIFKLSIDNSCPCKDNNQNTFYAGILMTILGVFLPSPRPTH